MTTAAAASSNPSLDYARGLARAFGGAILFCLPLLMTMEMWALGFEMDRFRLIVFILLGAPLIWGLSHFAGFRHTTCLRDDLLDASSGLAVGFIVSTALLAVFGVIAPGQPIDEVVGKVALQAIPAAIGAVLARKQLVGGESGDDADEESYPAELFLMAAGALFVALNVAPTEEMKLISYQMAPWQALLLVLGSSAILHAMVYSLGFRGQHSHDRPWQALLHFSVPGYAIVLTVALYLQWTFGHLDGHGLGQIVMTTVVIALPGAVGAGAARLLV